PAPGTSATSWTERRSWRRGWRCEGSLPFRQSSCIAPLPAQQSLHRALIPSRVQPRAGGRPVLRTRAARRPFSAEDAATATLYRPWVVRYQLPSGSTRLPTGKRVNKKTKDAVRIKTQSPTWWGRFKDRNGKPHQVKLSNSKETAHKMLLKMEHDAQMDS